MVFPYTNEVGHSISYKTACVPNKDSDQTVHMRRLIRVFAGHSVGSQGAKESSDVQQRL